MISNKWFRDRRVSLKAAGLRDWLASHKVGFRVSEKTIISAFTDGRESVRTAIRELETLGYLVRERERIGGKFSTVEYVLCDPFAAPNSTTDGFPVDGDETPPRTGNPSMDVTSGNTASPQVNTNDGFPDDGFSAPIRRTTTQKTKKKTNDENPASPLAVGADTVRTAREAVTTPSANRDKISRVAGEVLSLLPDHYRAAPTWLRARLLNKITDALADYGPGAVAAYAAKFLDDPNFGAYEHLRRFDDIVRKLAADVAEGITCPSCGLDARHPFCTAGGAR
ncbi:hypothetical protein ACSDR0_16995 [Streptosporangium sp. G11]|uniref:hypothetical protein n=1 Tax=Streptosporangium sp. G11 TaxID=3436926 RepID=UPI003EC13419